MISSCNTIGSKWDFQQPRRIQAEKKEKSFGNHSPDEQDKGECIGFDEREKRVRGAGELSPSLGWATRERQGRCRTCKA